MILSGNSFFAFNFPQTHLNSISLTILVTLRPLTQFEPKNRTTNLQKSAKISLTCQISFRSFHRDPNLILTPFKFGLGCYLER